MLLPVYPFLWPRLAWVLLPISATSLTLRLLLQMALIVIAGVTGRLFHVLVSVWAGAMDELSILFF